MKLPFLLGITAATLLLCSCATIDSSLNYTAGTEALVRGDYPTAVRRLEEAVRLDPKLSRNHANLAAAYMAVGRKDEAWRESRHAMSRNQNDPAGRRMFFTFWREFEQKGYLNVGNTPEKVRAALGPPDAMKASGNPGVWIYGRHAVVFQNGRLSKTAEF